MADPFTVYVGSLWEDNSCRSGSRRKGSPRTYPRPLEADRALVSWGGPLQVSLQVREGDAEHALALVEASVRRAPRLGRLKTERGATGKTSAAGCLRRRRRTCPPMLFAGGRGGR